MSRASRGRISREQVIDAALALLAGGVDACTIRAVAARLGVTPMAIYWHVADKDDLLDAVLDRVLDGVRPAPGPPADDPFETLAALARGYREAFGRHPHAAALLAARPAPRGERGLALMAAVVSLLRAGGLREDDLGSAALLLLEYSMGSVLLEHGLRPQGIELPVPLPDPGARFEFGLQCLLDGLRARVG